MAAQQGPWLAGAYASVGFAIATFLLIWLLR
jgi:hypothetical protein